MSTQIPKLGPAEKQEIQERDPARARRPDAARTRWAAALALAGALLALAAAGCGRHSSDSSVSNAATGPGPSTETAVVASTPNPSDTTGAKTRGGELSRDAVPPDVQAAAVDSVVTPGAVVEISALASPDVVDMGLSDGIGKEQPFAYDSTMKVWRALYRVPIRTTKDKLGLAVTATNESGHWRRVWVFLNLEP